MSKSLDNKTILVTGGTGSFGRAFVSQTLTACKPRRVIIYSRDEMKQWDMKLTLGNVPEVEFVIGDVRDAERLSNVVAGVDYIVHAAATKIVPTAEYNPSECIKTNINGAMNLINAANEARVSSVVALSTDKAVTQSISMALQSWHQTNCLWLVIKITDGSVKFSVVRYGNVMGSRGSVIPFFKSCASSGEIPITDQK